MKVLTSVVLMSVMLLAWSLPASADLTVLNNYNGTSTTTPAYQLDPAFNMYWNPAGAGGAYSLVTPATYPKGDATFGTALKIDPQIVSLYGNPSVPTTLSYTAGTIEMWIAPRKAGTGGLLGAGSYYNLFVHSQAGNGSGVWGKGLQIFIMNNGWPNDGGQVMAYWDDGTQQQTFNNSVTQPGNGGTIYGTTSGWSANSWHHIAFCWDATTLGLYLDGGVIAKVARTSISASTFGDFWLYSHYAGGGPYDTFDGMVDDFAIWNNAKYSGNYSTPGPVPEPATLALLAIGGLAALRRRS